LPESCLLTVLQQSCLSTKKKERQAKYKEARSASFAHSAADTILMSLAQGGKGEKEKGKKDVKKNRKTAIPPSSAVRLS